MDASLVQLQSETDARRGSRRINVQGYAAVQNGLCVSWRAGVYCGIVRVEVQEW